MLQDELYKRGNVNSIINNNQAGAVTPAESEEDMISLTKIFDLLGNDTSVIIRYGETKLYSGSVGKCTRDIWRNAYITDMGFSDYLGKYIIYVVYRL